MTMNRRELISIVGGALAGWSTATRAQQSAKVHRVAFIASTSPVSELIGADPINPAARAFVHGLRDFGYIEGKNLVLEMRSAEGRFESFPEIIRELVSIKVDVIVTVTNPMTRAARKVTETVPIVMLGINPVEEGLVQSLARPGGNITGVAGTTSLEVLVKRVQLFKEIIPRLSTIAYLDSKAETVAEWKQSAEIASREFGVQLLFAEHTPTDYTGAFGLITRERPDALFVSGSTANYANRRLIVEFAAKAGLPAAYPNRAFVDVGGLISYGADVSDNLRGLARYVDRILRGASPADLPVEQPTKFQLVINLKTAKALGITIPPALLARADEVIE